MGRISVVHVTTELKPATNNTLDINQKYSCTRSCLVEKKTRIVVVGLLAHCSPIKLKASSECVKLFLS